MSYVRTTNGFDKASEAKLMERALAIYEAISGKPLVFATPSPSMADLKDAMDAFAKAVADLKDGGPTWQVDQKNSLKQQLVDILHLLSYYVLFTAQGNRNIAMQSGFSISKEPVPIVVTTPEVPKVEMGEQKGWVRVSIKAIKGARSYVYQYTADPEMKEDSWMGMNCSKSRCTLEGLTPGTTYYFRVGVVGGKGQLLFGGTTPFMAA